MNYLAHVFLSGSESPEIIGAILGDFIKGRLEQHPYNSTIRRAILLHRKIDSYVDGHPGSLAARNLFSPYRRRFAGIILDIAYDHYLTNYWSRFGRQNRETFIRMIYDTLRRHQDLLPPRLRHMVPRMTAGDWLGSYRTLSGVDTTCKRLAARKRFYPLNGAVKEVQENYRPLEQHFLTFFPQLMAYVNTVKDPKAPNFKDPG